MTKAGGGHNYGTLFSMNTDGSGFGLLHSFSVLLGLGTLLLAVRRARADSSRS